MSGVNHVHKNRHYHDAGFTLIEVMVAFVVLLLVMVPFAYLLVAQVQSSVLSKQRLTAIGVAEAQVETLSNATPPEGTLGGPAVGVRSASTSHTVGGSVYSSQAEYSWVASGGTPDLCLSGVPQVLDLQVWVYWDGTRHFVTDNALIDYPPHGVQTLGFIAVQLTNSTTTSDNYGNPYSTRVQSVPVSIAGTDPAVPAVTLYPNQNGCVFVEVNPGYYTVGISDPVPTVPTGSNYGTPQFVANLLDQPTSPTPTPITVTTGQTSLAQYQYDEGSPVQVSYATAGTPVTPNSDIPLEVYNANLSPSTYWNIYPTGLASPATVLTGLYPFTDGYSIFAGDCTAESTPQGVASITTLPGQSTTITVPLASVTVDVTSSTGTAVANASVTMTAATTGCPQDVYTFAATGSGGSTTSAVPFGLYTVSASSGGTTSSPQTSDITVSPTTVSVKL